MASTVAGPDAVRPAVAYRGRAFRAPPSLEQTRRLTPATVIGELVASYLLIFIGTGAVVGVSLAAAPAKPDVLTLAIAWGFAVLVVVYAFGHVSGAHVNPSVTLGLAVTRKFPWKAVPVYLGAQFAGGILASLTVWAIFGSDARGPKLLLGTTMPGTGVSGATVLLTEAVITFILLLVVMATATDDRAESPAVGLGVGFVIAAGIITAASVTGASFNPMRTLAPMLLSGSFPAWAAYVVGPLAGGALGALAYDRLIRPGEPPEPAGAAAADPRGGAGARRSPATA